MLGVRLYPGVCWRHLGDKDLVSGGYFQLVENSLKN